MKKINPIRRGEHYYLRKRVPSRYAPIDSRTFVQVSLFTDSLDIARRKAAEVWAEMIEAWEAKLDGAEAEGEARLAAARNLAHRRGYRYLAASEVAKLPDEEFLRRLKSTALPGDRIDMKEADAALGLAPKSQVTVQSALTDFYVVAAEDLKGKNADQIRRWKNPRIKVTAEFLEVIGNKPLAEITTEDMFAYRKWWVDRVLEDEVKADTANKNMTHLLGMWRRVARSKGLKLPFSTDGLMLKSDKSKEDARPPFSTDWIRSRLLKDGALDGLNTEARLILIGMINTGYRPSEGAGIVAENIRLDADIPHIVIRPNQNRSIKNTHSIRSIPLLGVSLEAFRQAPDGFPRYAENSASLSATVNKFLRENKLTETDDHTMYSLRHSFEDRMLTAGIDERIRRDMMGHALDRERYGSGGDLPFLRDQLLKVAI